MKAYKTSKIEDYRIWNQPTLTSNGIMGGDYFAVEASSVYTDFYAYKAFDGNASTSFQDGGTSTNAYFTFYNPNPLKVTKITWSGTPTYGTIVAGIVYGSNNGNDWTKLATFSGGTTTGGTMNLSSNKNYYRFYKITPTDWTDKSNTHTNGWAELKITATEKVQTVRNAYLAVKQTVIEQVAWSQPTLTGDTTKVAEGDIVCTASSVYSGNAKPYMIMLNNLSYKADYNYWGTARTQGVVWLQIKFPYKLKITGLSVYSRPIDNYTGTVTAYTDSSMTTQIGEPVTTNAPVAKFTFLSGGSGIITDTIYLHVASRTSANDYYGLQNLQITAQKVDDNGNVILDSITRSVVKMVKGE